MGSNASFIPNKKYLSEEDINDKDKTFIIERFDKNKNSDGLITSDELIEMTGGFLNHSVCKKIIKICGSKKEKLTCEDLLYLYSVLKTNSFESKTNFLLDFIFLKSNSLSKQKYLHKVQKYFYCSDFLLNILINNNEVNSKVKIEREKIFSYLKIYYYKELNNYKLCEELYNVEITEEIDTEFLENNKKEDNKDTLKEENNQNQNKNENQIEKNNDSINKNINIDEIKGQIKNNNNININNRNESNHLKDIKPIISKEDLRGSKNIDTNNMLIKDSNKYCFCLGKENLLLSSIVSNRTNKNINNAFDRLRKRFELYKSANNGIFPIELFESMLKEINVLPSLIFVIGNFLRKKTEKSFINFELFKEVLSMITLSNDDLNNEKLSEILTNQLFLLFSYPKDYVEKKALFIFIQLTKENINLDYINKIVQDYQIGKFIYKDKFSELIKFIINEFIESFEHIKYIPFIFFNEPLKDKKLEKNCIEILLKGEQMSDYIKKKLEYEKKFYVIDCKFWNKWQKLMYGNDENDQKELDNLTMSNKAICDHYGRLYEGLVYQKDYIILTSRMYHLFRFWYGPPKIVIDRDRIQIDDEEDNEEQKVDENNKFNINIKRLQEDSSSTLQIENEYHKKYEIEIYPIFLLFLNFEEAINLGCKSLDTYKAFIKQKVNHDKQNNYYKFSRKDSFGSILQKLQNSIGTELDNNNSRLWLYYQERFEIILNERTLEQEGVVNSAVIILELSKNGLWPSEQLIITDNKSSNNEEENNYPFVGLTNLGNTCYMNSVLQNFLNIKEIKDIFIKKGEKEEENFLKFIGKNRKKKKGKLIKEFIKLLNEKWHGTKKTITPSKFKEIVGGYNENFGGYEQQDAYDFYTFLLDILHEETNIKLKKNSPEKEKDKDKNKEEEKITEDIERDLGNENWANIVRNNASYIYGLFMGQLKSELICKKCGKKNLKFEPFSSLDIPIPEERNIILYVSLFRLPLALSPFYKEKERAKNRVKDIVSSLNKTNTTEMRTLLKTIRNNNMGKFNNGSLRDDNEKDVSLSEISIANEEIVNLKNNTKKRIIGSQLYSPDSTIFNPLNLNIPIKLKIEIDRNKKCKNIISYLKQMTEFDLEADSNFTEFIILSNNLYINEDLTINDAFKNKQEIYVYELLNFNGIKSIFGYKNLQLNDTIKLIPNEISSMINNKEEEEKKKEFKKENQIINISNVKEEEEKIKNKEIVIEIVHRFKLKKYRDNYLFENLPVYNYLSTFRDFIILTTKNCIKPLNLYEMIWEKFMYFIELPSQENDFFWWKQKNNEKKFNTRKLNHCSPFVIKIINKSTRACSYCPWFRFCSGCILNPFYNEYVTIPCNCYLVVEWCYKLRKNEINDNNLSLILEHSSMTKQDNRDVNKNIISLYDCLNLFTGQEILKDIICENCKAKQEFTKSLKIERLPNYLVIVLKRFKYTSMYKNKIESYITFPIYDFHLERFMTTQNKENYELFSIINHTGTMSYGHYYSVIKHQDKWILYNDSNVTEFDESVESPSAYILIYKKKKIENKKILEFNFLGLMDTAYRIYLKQNRFSHLFNYLFNENGEILQHFENDCEFYYGEPVSLNGEKGYLLNIVDAGDNFKVTIKFKKIYSGKIYKSKMKKETINDDFEGNENNKGTKDYAVCSGCLIV